MIASFFTPLWSKTTFMVGLFQLLLTYILIGWIFSIYWGYLFVRKTWEDNPQFQQMEQKIGSIVTAENMNKAVVVGGVAIDAMAHTNAGPNNNYNNNNANFRR